MRCRVSDFAGAFVLAAVLVCLATPAAAQLSVQSAPPPRQEPAGASPQPAGPIQLTDVQKLERQADLMMARKQYTDAAGAYQSALELEPRNPILLNKAGIAHHQLMRLDLAKKFYERSIKAHKTYAYAYNNLGALYYDQQKYRQAANQFKKAIGLQPDLAAAHGGLGCSLFARKKYDEAIASIVRALELDPELFERKSMFGTVVQSRGVADRPAFYFVLAKSYAMQGNAERCAHYLRRARDEGYKGMGEVAKDPAFANVIKDPLVQEVLIPPPTSAATR